MKYRGQTINSVKVREGKWLAPIKWANGREETTTGMEYSSTRFDAIRQARIRIDRTYPNNIGTAGK